MGWVCGWIFGQVLLAWVKGVQGVGVHKPII